MRRPLRYDQRDEHVFEAGVVAAVMRGVASVSSASAASLLGETPIRVSNPLGDFQKCGCSMITGDDGGERVMQQYLA